MKTNKTKMLLNAIPVILLLALTIWMAMIYPDISEIIPTHYNMAGDVDGWSSRSTIWILVGVSWGVCLMLIGMTLIPKKIMIKHMNGFDNCTEEKKEKAFDICMRMLQYINIILTAMFCYMTVAIAFSYSSLVLSPFIIVMVAVTIVQTIRMLKIAHE